MSATFTIGVDPGIHGAIAVYNASNGFMDVIDFPLIATQAAGRKTVRNEIDEHGLAHWVKLAVGVDRVHAYVEKVGAMPKQGVSSTFRFGMSYGIIRGILTAHDVPYTLVRPQDWKKHMSVGRNKDEARLLASRMFPRQAEMFRRKKDANRAEAVLLAVYGATNYGAKHG